MKLPMTDELCREIARFDLRFTCEDCVHFDPGSDPDTNPGAVPDAVRGKAQPTDLGTTDLRARCIHGYPSAPHRRGAATDHVLFCKEFELT